MADGPVIQHSNEIALQNGMSLKVLFSQLQAIRNEVDIPLILMGYINPVIQFGVENFCRQCSEMGIDGVILPDLPPEIYIEEYLPLFERFELYNILLITPQSDDDRISAIDKISRGFIYMVSTSSVTGVKGKFSENQLSYFKKVNAMTLNNPGLIGFGISDHDSFNIASENARGGIIGSAFVKLLGKDGNLPEEIFRFVKEIRG
jgi:tryptophan synthase alpha chain